MKNKFISKQSEDFFSIKPLGFTIVNGTLTVIIAQILFIICEKRDNPTLGFILIGLMLTISYIINSFISKE